MSDEETYVTEPVAHPEVAKAPLYEDDPQKQLLKRMQEMAEASALDLRGARERTETHIAEISRRVALGEASAEMLAPLQAEVDKARQVEQQLAQHIKTLKETSGNSD